MNKIYTISILTIILVELRERNIGDDNYNKVIIKIQMKDVQVDNKSEKPFMSRDYSKVYLVN